MTEEELRAVVREVIAERLAARGARVQAPAPQTLDCRSHASHGLLRMAPSVEKGQPCIIEPEVACGLCGFCQSHGH